MTSRWRRGTERLPSGYERKSEAGTSDAAWCQRPNICQSVDRHWDYFCHQQRLVLVQVWSWPTQYKIIFHPFSLLNIQCLLSVSLVRFSPTESLFFSFHNNVCLVCFTNNTAFEGVWFAWCKACVFILHTVSSLWRPGKSLQVYVARCLAPLGSLVTLVAAAPLQRRRKRRRSGEEE